MMPTLTNSKQTGLKISDMRPDFWLESWSRGRIGFHRAAVDDRLKRYWQDLDIAVAERVFVPLCGKTLDLLWLRDQGHPVIGVELSDIAAQAFCMENGVACRRRSTSNFDIYSAPNFELFCGDIFRLSKAELHEVTAVYDRAALVSWTEELRDRYVTHMAELTPPGSKTLLVTLEYDQTQMAGPPFSVPFPEVERLYESHHTIQILARYDVLPVEPRLRARGVTKLHEVFYRLTRL